MSASLAPQKPIPASVAERLSWLRTQIVIWFIVDGLGRVLLLALALAAADLLLDWMFRMDVSQRGIMLVLMIGALVGTAYWRLVRPFAHMPSDDALCLSVENRHKNLGQSLISAVQFSREGDYETRGVSQSLVQATIESGVAAAGRVSFGAVLDGARFLWNSVLLAVSVALVAAVGVGVVVETTGPLAIWFNRNIMLGERVWPQRTYLEVQNVKNGKIRLPRGENWTQGVFANEESQEIPESVFVDFRPSRGRPSQKMKKTGDNTYEIVFNNVIEEFQFRARGGDSFTPWIKVELVEQPAVKDLTLLVTPPKYAGATQESLPTGKGPYYVLKGSSMQLTGEANKPLSVAELTIEGKQFELAIDKNKTTFSIDLSPEQLIAGTYVIRLTDDEGLVSKRPTSFGLRMRPDREPRVRAKLMGISGMVVPQAMLPFNARVSDDYGAVGVKLSFQWRSEEGDTEPKPGSIEFEELASKLPSLDITFNNVFDLPPHKIPSGSSLSFRIEATDNDDVSGPNIGRSPEFLVKVVTEEQLRTDLLRREKEQRQEFERLLKSQEDLTTETRALAATVAGQKDLAEEQKLALMAIGRRQKLVGTNTGTIAERLKEFLTEVKNNRLEEEGGPLERRLSEKIIVPMTQINAEGVPEAMQRLDKSRRLAGAAAERDPALAEAVTQQELLAAQMREILIHMVKAEGYQEAVNLLYEIEKSQKGVYDLTEKEKQERIKKILEEGGKIPDPKPEDKKPEEKKPEEKKPQDKPADEKKPDEKKPE